MALLSLLFNKPKNVSLNVSDEFGSERELLVLDSTKNISHINNANPTDNPVEDGSKITDHVDVEPKVLSFEGIVSVAPLTLAAAAIGNVAGAVPALAGFGGTPIGTLFTGATAALGGLLLNGRENRAQQGFDTLEEIMKKSIPVTIITGLKAYNNMILTSFNPVQTADIGDSLRFTATFREIVFVQSELVVLPSRVLSGDTKNKGSSVQNQGKKVAGETSSPGKASSILAKITGFGA